MSGTLSTRLVEINDDSGFLSQLTDVIMTNASHDQTIKYDSTNWVNADMSTLGEVGDVELTALSHNDVLIWNAATNRWENGKLTSLLTQLEGVVNGIVSIKLSVYIGEELGDSARALAVAFTDDVESGFTMAIGSCGDNNAIYKKEPAEIAFSFLTTLNKGQRLDLALPAGTVFRSDKGIAGFSCPFPMPFGISNLSANYFRFFALRNDNVVHVTSAGRDSLVVLLASDETTVVDGPTFVNAYGSAVLTCNANAEFVVKSTTDIFCGTKGDRGAGINNNRFIDMRLVPPMATEIIVHSRNNRLSARFADTTVTYHRRNMTTGTFTVQGGTPLDIAGATGNQQDYNPDGFLILRANKPITSFSGADSIGWESTPGWPLTALAQVFPIISAIGGSNDFGAASITLAGPYEGTCTVYNEEKVALDTFTLTRGTSPASTPEDQLYPTAGQWNPQVSLGITVQSGYIEVNVPCVCVCNFDGSSIYNDGGDEVVIPGTSPDDIKAVIRKDSAGFLRRRDVDASGNESWNLC